MKAPNKKDTSPSTLDLRDRLKALVESELDRLPKLLEGLKDKERLDVILRLTPLVMPKVKPIHYSTNEESNSPFNVGG